MLTSRWVSLVAITVVLLSGCASTTQGTDEVGSDNQASSIDASPEFVATQPLSETEYAARFSELGAPAGSGDFPEEHYYDDEGVLAEYLEAAAAFPFPLPSGFGYPVDGIANTSGDMTLREEGRGSTIVFFYWADATALAALADHERGDENAAHAHLDDLEAGYASPIRSAFIDPEHPGTSSPYIAHAVASARMGDWSVIRDQAEVFVENPTVLLVAGAAGDLP